jgi:peptide-methionine (S)-S-oxide reductase
MVRSLLVVFLLLNSFPLQAQTLQKATFAAGCFWCAEEVFEKVPGVVSAVAGYIGGNTKNPTYEQVSSGTTGHTEAVQVTFDPSKVSYEKLLDTFWVNHDPTVTDRQFCDRGSQYRPAIFVYNDEQKRLAEASKAKWEKLKPFKQPILTPVVQAGEFWPAEEYHQDYYKKNPVRYKFYVTGCGRYDRLDQLWGKLRAH